MARQSVPVVWVVIAGVVVVGILGYAIAAFVGMVPTPPGVPRANEQFTTLTWSQTEYGSSTLFRTVTIEPDGSYVERFESGPGGDSRVTGTVPDDLFAKIKRLATDPRLAAESRAVRYRGVAVDCTDSATIRVEMGKLEIAALDCGDATAEVLPVFYELHTAVRHIASDVSPPGGA